MEKGFVENGFIIDLSDAKNTTQLVFELSSIMEHPDVKRKNVCLKLGSLDLKQSQLLSIKALIESMDASIAFIDTNSEQTEASAVSLGIIVSEISDSSVPSVGCTASEEIKEEAVVVKTEDEAKELYVRIQNGESFTELAEEYSLCPSKQNGGDLGFFGKGMMVAPFEKAAFELEVGDVSEPVQTQFGWHLIYLTGKN